MLRDECPYCKKRKSTKYPCHCSSGYCNECLVVIRMKAKKSSICSFCGYHFKLSISENKLIIFRNEFTKLFLLINYTLVMGLNVPWIIYVLNNIFFFSWIDIFFVAILYNLGLGLLLMLSFKKRIKQYVISRENEYLLDALGSV